MRTFFLILLTFLALQAYSQYLNHPQAQEDIQEFKQLLEKESSYLQVATINLDALLQNEWEVLRQQDSIPIIELNYALKRVMAKIPDSHASVRLLGYDDEKDFQYRMRFPFGFAPYGEKVVALSRAPKYGTYTYFHDKYPYLSSINGLEIYEFLRYYSFDNERFPENARLRRGLHDLRKIGLLYTRQSDTLNPNLTLILSDGQRDTTFQMMVNRRNTTWRYKEDMSLWAIRDSMDDGLPFQYKNLIRDLDDEVAYMAIPKMLKYRYFPDFEVFLEDYLESIREQSPKGLIFDLRGNTGGVRDLINTLSKYIIPVHQSPWVANIAYIRSDQYLEEDISSMEGKYLYTYHSHHLSNPQRDAIDTFLRYNDHTLEFAKNKFSAPFFMVMSHYDSLFLDVPIYLLCDEGTFSAASIMASVFKGLDNVKICGTTTNGSSGRSRYFYLTHSNIRLKLSTMLSFQRNGLPLDGYGTEPDIWIQRDIPQIMGEQDSQLIKLVEIIKKTP